MPAKGGVIATATVLLIVSSVSVLFLGPLSVSSFSPSSSSSSSLTAIISSSSSSRPLQKKTTWTPTATFNTVKNPNLPNYYFALAMTKTNKCTPSNNNTDNISNSNNANVVQSSNTGKKSTTTTTTAAKKLYSFTEARRIARGHGFDSYEEFMEYTCPGAYQIPKNAHEIWAEEWRGWDDFLGICLGFQEGREIARSLEGITTEESYLQLIKSKSIPEDSTASRLPYRPDLKYKAEWNGWDDFLIG